MSNFEKVGAAKGPRTELHNTLHLTGAEISINNLPAGGSVPFVHHHKKNEEIYYITAGSGHAMVDGTKVELATGDWLKINPAGKDNFLLEPKECLMFVFKLKLAHLKVLLWMME